MTCMEPVPHNDRYEWSVTEGVDLMYDSGNLNCYAKVKIKYLGYDIYGNRVSYN